MPRRGRAHRRGDGQVLFLSGLRAGLALPSLPGALCARPGQDPDFWFPANGDRAGAERAKAACFGCPVRSRCLDWALAAGERSGVWGGTTPNERHQLRKTATEGRTPGRCGNSSTAFGRILLMPGNAQATRRSGALGLALAGAS